MTSNAIEIRALEKHFPTFALGPLDMTVPTGAIYGLIGPNGAGKTTTLDLIFGLGEKQGGTITVLGLDDYGLAASWVRRYGGPEGTGFVRVPPDDMMTMFLAAEYRPGK